MLLPPLLLSSYSVMLLFILRKLSNQANRLNITLRVLKPLFVANLQQVGFLMETIKFDPRLNSIAFPI